VGFNFDPHRPYQSNPVTMDSFTAGFVQARPGAAPSVATSPAAREASFVSM